MAGSRRKTVNTKRSGNTRGRNTSLSAINKNKPATQKTVVSKPKSTTTNKSTVSGRALRNESARKADTGNTQRQKKTTKPQERKSFSSRMNNYQGTSGNRRKQMTAQTHKTAQDNLKKTANTMKDLTKGNIKQIAGSHATTFNSIRNPNEEMHARAEEFKRQRGDYDNQKKSPYLEGQYGQLLNRERNNKEQREKNLAKASRKIDSGTKLIEKEKEKMGEAGKFAADLYGAGLGLASDALAGPASMVSMFSRSYGSSYKTAKDEGATDSQAALYGAAAGGLEAATERLFAVAKPLQKIYGKGAGDKIFDTLLDKVAKKATSKGANDLIYHGGKTLGSFVSEALEEMIVEGLEPSIANQIYAEAVGTPHETSAKDVLYAGLLGGAMGGILGGGGQIMEYSRGEQVKDIYGEDGLKAAADRVSQADEDSGNGAMGTLVKDMISAGEDVNARYANELYRADQAQMARDSEKLDVARTVAENSIRSENLKSPVAVDDKGEIMLSRNTKAKYDETVARAQEEADKLQVPDLTREKLAESVARIQTGTADVNDVNLFLLNNPEARTVYQVVTGESLPKTNQETRQYLYEKIGNNLITAAKIETADHADRIKGVMEQNLSTDYEVSGQEAFAQHFQGIDVRNVQQVEHDVITFDDYYRAARNGISYEQVEAYQNPIHMRADTEFKRMAYEAGQRDVAISLDTAKGMQLELGKAVSKSSLKQRSRAGKGRLISEISPEMQMEFSASQQIMYRMLARAFNINIHVVDTLQNEDGAKTNGYYVDGEVYLSLDGDRSLEYIFAHEITHHMQAYAPKEYNQLKELVRQRWAQKGGIDAAVNAKKAQYTKGGVNLSYEDALDEIIADSTYEMLQDEGFIEELCRSHRNVAQRLLDAIRDVLAKLRNVLAEGDSFTPQQNAGLLSELDILKDFERIWVNGLMRAAENSDAVGQGSVQNTKKSLVEIPSLNKYAVLVDTDQHIFEGKEKKDYPSIAKKYLKERFQGTVIGNINKTFINAEGVGEYAYPAKNLGEEEDLAKMKAAPELENMLDAAFEKEPKHYDYNNPNPYHPDRFTKDNGYTEDWELSKTIFILGDQAFEGVINIELIKKGRLFKDVTQIKNITNSLSDSNGKLPLFRTVSDLTDIIPDSQQNGNKKLSLPDTEYMAAVEKGDMETAQRMVDEAAEAAMKHSEIRDNKGKLLKVYHGTTAKFNSFNDPNHTPYGEQGNFYFSPWRSKSEEYGDNIRAFYLNIERPRLYDENFDELNPNTDETDGFIFIPEDIEQDIDQGKQGDTEIVAYYPDQIKSADPVTYDDDGNVIPLSERFNSQSDDIRYSLPDTDSNGRELSEGQQSFFKNSQMRNEEGKLIPMYHGTTKAGFTVFDSDYSDDGLSFFFTDDPVVAKTYSASYEIFTPETIKTVDDVNKILQGEKNPWYEATEESGKYVIWERWNGLYDKQDSEYWTGDSLEDLISTVKEDFLPGEQSGSYEVYLNLENPLIIDAKGESWGNITGEDKQTNLRLILDFTDFENKENGTITLIEAVNHERNDKKFSSYREVEDYITNTYGNETFDLLAYEVDKDDVEFPTIALTLNGEGEMAQPYSTREWAEEAHDKGYDGVIFKNLADTAVYATNEEDGKLSTVAIAFYSDQIKDVTNKAPTHDDDIRYSLQDSEGRELSEGQQEYFARSLIRDEDGRLIPMYHGTPNGDYDAFRKGTYFTANKDYADVYQSQGASSLGYKKTANKPDTYEVYLNIEKPFDTRNPKEKKIFEEEFLGQWGTGTPLMDSGLPDWLDGEDLIEFLEEKGYDYDGLILDEGGVGGYGDEVVSRGFSYVIFDSNQAKSIDNENPTDDPRMRFSLKEPVEETKDLIALHNISEDELLKTISLGGFPMPSIAIVKDDHSHSNYGDISVLFGKDTIDPKASKSNKVYGGDAWTPVFPSVDYKVNEKVAEQIENHVESLIGRDLTGKLRLALDYSNMSDNLNRWDGNAFKAYERSEGLRYAFLKEKGIDIDIPTREAKLGRRDNKFYIAVAEKFGKDKLQKIHEDCLGEYQKDDNVVALVEIFNEFVAEKYKALPGLAKSLHIEKEDLGFADFDEMTRGAYRYITEGIKEEQDVYALEGSVNNYFAEHNLEAEYESWLGSLFTGVIESEGIRNDKDIFTPSGNRRSWDSLHMAVTLENVVKAMKKQDEKGAGVLGLGSPFGAAQRNFTSIDDIRASKGRLQHFDKEKYDEIREGYSERFSEIAQRFAKGNRFDATLDAGKALVENIAKSNSKAQLDRNLRGESQWFNYSELITDDLWELVKDIQSMPTEYFEAKPQRAVGLDEIKAVIIPDNSSAELKTALDDKGIEYNEYEAGNEEDRKAKINSVATEKNIRFSLPDEEAVYDYINSNETEFVEVPPVRDYERKGKSVKDKSIEELQKQVEILKRDKKLTHGKVLNKNSIREQLNILVRTLMSHSEGTANKTDGKLVKTALENAEIIFKAIKDGDVYTAATTSYYAAEHIVENLKLVDDTMFNEYKDLRDYLRTTKVTISEQDRSNISDFKEFRKRNMGRIRITNEGGMAVDDLYQTLCERWPGMFDPEITHPADQLQEIADVRDQLDPYDVMLSEEETKQLIKEAAHDLLEISANGKPWQSWADRQRDVYDQKVKKLKARHVEALRDVRTKANEKADERVKAEREKAKNKAEAEKMAVAREQAEKKRAQQESQERKNAESEKRRHINRIEKDLKWLSDRLLKPTDAKHLPDGYQKAIAELLVMVDPQSARSKKLEEAYGISKKRANFLRLKAEYENIAKSEAEGMIYNEDIANWCDELAATLDDADSIANATVEEMRVIRQLIRAITHSIRQQNKAFDENLKSGIAEAARETIHKAKTSRKTGQRGGVPGALGTLLNESMVSPRDFFEGIGGGINKAFMSIRKGHDKHIENITEARTFFADLFGQYANKKKPGSAIEEWRNHKTNEKFELDGGTVTMNISQRMALYCLLKREQAAGHIFGSGIVVAEASTMNKLKESLGAKKDLNFGTTRITMQEAYDIVKTLTPEQIEIADKLQDFLNGACAEWGNEASLKMFGYKKFTEENYFPIQSADVYLDSNFEGRQAVERIRNFGFTKGTVVNANNPIVIDDIFTVVADHVNKMSMYNAFAAPIADFTRVYNFKSRDDSGLIIESTKDVLANTYGKKVGRYITNFIADLQSNTQTRQEGFTRFVNKTLANYKKASIAANIRVALQQPTALVRAFTVIDPKYFVLKNHTPLLLQKAKGADTDYKDMLDHCPIARWKSWGFSQVDMARDIDDIMMNKEWSKLDFVTMQLYGALDLYTWSKIWGAVRAETKAKHPEVKVDSEEFYAICNERASEVFDKTQVVDSVLHRSQVMRNTDTMSKVLTSFMAEPTRTYNMVRSEYAAAMDMWADGEKAKAGMRVAKASSVYLLNALACAAAAAIADALRGKDLDDDDEPETWWELTKVNFMSNANPLNLLPVFKEVSSIWKGWDTSNMALEGIEALVKAEKGIVDKLKGESDKPWSELIRKQAEAIGLVFGVPVKNILREAETWSKILGIDVFAAEVGEEVEEEKKILKIEDGSDFDNFLNMLNVNLSDKEMMDKNFDKTVKSYNKATKDMTEAEKQEYLWEKITDGYTKDIEAGDYDSINNMRRLLKETGGDYEKFNESVISRTKTEMKKTIGVDSAATEEYRYQLKKLGMTDEIINQEVVMKSDAAKAFQLEACEDDYDGMVETIRTLYDAGLTELELDVLYYNRTKAISAKDYQTGSLVAPCNGEITSTFGYRNAPTAGASSNHKGIDIAVAANTEIVAADGGKVSSAGYNSGYGYYVKVYHGNGRYTMYAHLNGYYKDKGMAVAKGEAIGLSGSTGVSTGPHLHFEVIENGVNVDPLPYLQ